ncbi:MAG TPA: proline--tRNA ligase [Thermodesulfobacteriota bacterium]|nr:proline--tRNA ligase [Deltaproteobacteria bacterium]HNU72797.1 proline--tRNA ligase [Thermodesulfobacteriota bacterium]HQO77261.1 proline--tRNA ligase [Thermodesulfobacteriota bacterium]
MLYSRLLLPTLKEVPADAEVVSHKLMLRAGMIRKLAAGIYSYLPLAQRTLQKLKTIIREEMNRAGGQEVVLPAVQPAEIWVESKRWDFYGKELLRFKDRHSRDFCLGPTHEEVITDLVRREVRSYRQLPLLLYQIQTKFRDEIRPRFGVMRSREFLMKDAYSFDCTEAGAESSYRDMYEAYSRIFERCGLEFRAVEADTGTIGGSFSHEFMVLADSGEDTIIYCDACGYAANQEKAEIQAPPSAQAEESLQERKAVATPGQRTVEEVTGFLGVSSQKLIKTLIFSTDRGPVAALVRGDHEINEIKLRNMLGASEIALADDAVVEEVTSAPRGFAGPVGLSVKIYADNGLIGAVNMVTGGNEKDVHFINVNTPRDFTVTQYADLRQAGAGDPCGRCGGSLNIRKGIEVGHIFKLGTKYSEALHATYLDEQGKEQLIIMGCYGIGVGRTVAAAIEQSHDKDGIIFPKSLTPFHAYILPISLKDEPVHTAAFSLYAQLTERGMDVLLDDRDERPGIKFKDADLIGVPLRITVGMKTLAEEKVEVRERKTGKVELVRLNDTADYVRDYYKE